MSSVNLGSCRLLVMTLCLLLGINWSVVQSQASVDLFAADPDVNDRIELEPEVVDELNKLEQLQARSNVQEEEDEIISNSRRAVAVGGGAQAANCLDIVNNNEKARDGVYYVTVQLGSVSYRQPVYCDMTTDGGGWLLIQRRFNGKVNFFRGWKDYAHGFGQVNGEYWLGNDMIHALTASDYYTLRIDMVDASGNTGFAEYNDFKIGSAAEKYKLASLGSYSDGDRGDSLTYHLGQSFSTRDKDNDPHATHCAAVYQGAWWYNGCHLSNLNGAYGNTNYGMGLIWRTWTGVYASLVKTEMKIRPNI